MFVILTVIKGNDNGKSFRLADGEERVLGRSSQAGVILSDPGVSRRHCSLRFAGETLYVSDLGSRNGTFVNDLRIEPGQEVSLADGDLLTMGQACLRVRMREMIEVAPPKRGDAPAPIGGIEALPQRGNLEPALPAHPDEGFGSGMRAAPYAPAFNAKGNLLRLQDDTVNLMGRTLGGCRITAQMGEDDAALIFRAVQVSMEREVTLRVLHPQLAADKSNVERFLEIAREAGRLSHPHLLRVYDAGEESGLYYVALEFAGDETVRRRMEQNNMRPFDLYKAVEAAEQIAGALDYAHSHRTLHRAVTPENVAIMDHGVAKLANLGFARGPASVVPGEAGYQWIAPYAAPEALASPLSESPQSDIYSLGGVLYLMTTGRPPAVAAAGEANIPRAGRQTPVQKLRKEVSQELAGIIDRAMAPVPMDRYGRASELQAALQQERERLRR